MEKEEGFLWIKVNSNNVPVAALRHVFTWGTYGKKGKARDYKRVLLKDMSNSHIENIINDYTDGSNYSDDLILAVFVPELIYRKRKGIYIEDD